MVNLNPLNRLKKYIGHFQIQNTLNFYMHSVQKDWENKITKA